MLHISFDSFHKVRDKVVSSGQLHVNLGEGIFDTISQIDQTIVDADSVHDYGGNQCEEYY